MVNKRPRKRWWFFAAFLFLFFVLLQVPAAWILARVAPQNAYVDSISGSLWQGQADWRFQNAQGVVSWRFRPLSLLTFKVGADVELHMGETRLDGQLALGYHQVRIEKLNGQIASDTLATLFPWQWPSPPIQLHDMTVIRHKEKGWQRAEGQMNWGGGMLGYPFEGHVERANLPPLVATISADQGKLQLNLTNGQRERMGDIYLSADNMLEVQLTQRLLLTVSGYHGQAGMDTAVVSTRQPLSSLSAQ